MGVVIIVTIVAFIVGFIIAADSNPGAIRGGSKQCVNTILQ